MAWVLGKLELVFYRAIYPTLTNEADFFVIFRWKYILPAAAAATVLALLVSAFFGRFGAKGGLIIYFGALLTFFLSIRVIDAVEDAPDSLLGRFGQILAGWFGSVNLAIWIVLGAIAVIVLLVISLRLLLRQEVKY